MIYPSIDKLLTKVESKYTLVVSSARRARLLQQGAAQLVKSKSKKSVTIALEEILAGQVQYQRIKEGTLK
ncbi:MAG: DNA-directed RNA polymerase subunit omega [Firmicutes bacterium]|nr:DNA-directed RNA polymerase subunit omega [Bacillota bacterium]